MRYMEKLVFIPAALAVAACSSAPKSNEVSASYVSVNQYSNYSCEQLINETDAIRRATPALEAAVDKHRSNQTGVEVVTWLLFWPAAFALDKGHEYSEPLAKAKGELQAINTALMTKKCGEKLNVQAETVTPAPTQPVLATSGPPQTTEYSVAMRLKDLEQLKKDGIVSDSEYQKKRDELLSKL